MSKLTGSVEFEFDGKTYRIFYGYAELSEVVEKYGEDVFERLIKLPPMHLADILAIGMRANHPEMTTAQVAESSPPVLEVARVVDKAFLYAFYGPKKAEELAKLVEQAQDKKKAN